MTRTPVLHSDLHKFLSRTGVSSDLRNQLLSFTAGGVVAEAGEIPANYRAPFDNQSGEQAMPAPKVSGFKFGLSSQKEMQGVDRRLVQVAHRALELTTQDFVFFDGLRTLKEQQALVAQGMSKTMQSKHLEGLAMDLVPYHNGGARWDWNLIYPVVHAVDQAATEQGVAHLITWGGAWDRKLSDFGGSPERIEAEVRAYASRHAGKDFLDGPHFEIQGPRQQ